MAAEPSWVLRSNRKAKGLPREKRRLPKPIRSTGRRPRHSKCWSTALLAVLLLALLGSLGYATGPTTITFAEHAPGTVVDTEYASVGIRFGTIAELGAPSLAQAWNCGAPQVKEPTSDGPPPRLAQAPVCGGRSGTVAAFTHPRKTMSLVVSATPSTLRAAEIFAYAADGTLLTSREAPASGVVVTIDRPTPDVAYLVLQLSGEGGSALLFDDLTFDHLGDQLGLSPRGVIATAGVPRTDNVARLTDTDPTATAGDYAVTIEWGDGQASAGQVVASDDGFDVIGTHTYSRTGTYTIKTTAVKVNGVRAVTTSSARVTDAPALQLSLAPTVATVPRGQNAQFTVTVTASGFTGTVTLGVTGALGSFSPPTVAVPGSSQLTVPTTTATPLGSSTLAVSARADSLVATATATLIVTTSPTASPTVVARLAPARQATALSFTTLDASRSKGAKEYRWDVTGDGRDDVTCGGKTPTLGLRLRNAGARTVRVTAVARNGSTSVAQRTLTVRKRGGSGAPKGLPEVATCLGNVATYLEGVACAEKVVVGVVEAKGCFTLATTRDDVPGAERIAFDAYRGDPSLRDPLVARGPVKVNGVSFVPSRGAAIVLFPQLGRLVSSRASVRVGGMQVRAAAPVNLPLFGAPKPRPADGTLGKRGRSVAVFTFKPSGLIRELGGFALDGEASLSFRTFSDRYESVISVRLALPKVFSLFGEAPPSGLTRLVADNDRGLVVDEIEVVVEQANLGAILFKNLSFTYKAKGEPRFGCPRRWWKATAEVYLSGSSKNAGFRLAPDPQLNGIAFCDGRFDSAGGEYVFGAVPPPPQIFPGVYLKSIGFAVDVDPTLILLGRSSLEAAGLMEVSGKLLMMFPTPNAPYRVAGSVAGSELASLADEVFTSTTIAVGGDMSVRVPGLGSIPFGAAYAAYSYPDYVTLGGMVRIPAPGLAFNAGIDGELAVRQAQFSLHGFGEVCIAGLACVLRAEGWVTSTGVVVCFKVAGELNPGAGFRWGSVWPEIWLIDGCKPSPYWVTVKPPNQRSTGQSLGLTTTTFTVARGERAKNVRLTGVGGAPRIEVRGPTGELVSASGDTLVLGKTIAVLRQNSGRVTWIGVANGAPGTYTVSTLPGSTAIEGVAATRRQADHVKASVSVAGSDRVLRYDVARLEGRRVAFYERGRTSYKRVVVTTGGRGALRFKPAQGPAGTRQILAQVELNGQPSPPRVVARYRVAPPPRLRPPTRLYVRRTAASVSVRWAAVAAATRYALVLRLRNGVQRVVTLPPRRRTVVFRAIPATQAGTVTVRAIGPGGVLGPAASGRFSALKRQPSSFLPLSELRRPR